MDTQSVIKVFFIGVQQPRDGQTNAAAAAAAAIATTHLTSSTTSRNVETKVQISVRGKPPNNLSFLCSVQVNFSFV